MSSRKYNFYFGPTISVFETGIFKRVWPPHKFSSTGGWCVEGFWMVQST